MFSPGGACALPPLPHLSASPCHHPLPLRAGGNLGFETAPFKLSYEMTQLLDPGGTRASPTFRRFMELATRGFLAARTAADSICATVALMAPSQVGVGVERAGWPPAGMWRAGRCPQAAPALCLLAFCAPLDALPLRLPPLATPPRPTPPAQLPCFGYGKPLEALRARFRLELTDAQAAAYMKQLILSSYDKTTTGLYDVVQLLQNKIPA